MQQLGKLETQFFAWQQLVSRRKIETGDVCNALGINGKQERELLSRLKRKGLIVRIRKGLYLAPEKIPPGGIWQPNEIVLLETLMKDCRAKYQVSGLFAFQYYGFSEQTANELFVYNNKISGRRRIGTASFIFGERASSSFGNTVLIGDSSVPIGSLERIMFDAVYDWKRFNSLPSAYSWIFDRRENPKLMSGLVSCVIKYGNISTLRRIGYLLDVKCDRKGLARKLMSQLNESKSYISFDPTKPKRGKISKKWGLVINDESLG